MSDPRHTRSAEDALAKLQQLDPQPEPVSPEVVAAGKDLLKAIANGFGHRVISWQNMRSVLVEMIKETEFSTADIQHVTEVPGHDAYEGMYVMMGTYGDGTGYNVWFAREGKNWLLKYSQIPHGGNLRQATDIR